MAFNHYRISSQIIKQWNREFWGFTVPVKLARFHLLCWAKAWEHSFGQHFVELGPSLPLEAENQPSNSKFYSRWRFQKYWRHLPGKLGTFRPKWSIPGVSDGRHARRKEKNWKKFAKKVSNQKKLPIKVPIKLCSWNLALLVQNYPFAKTIIKRLSVWKGCILKKSSILKKKSYRLDSLKKCKTMLHEKRGRIENKKYFLQK